jgi:hypothetical protein
MYLNSYRISTNIWRYGCQAFFSTNLKSLWDFSKESIMPEALKACRIGILPVHDFLGVEYYGLTFSQTAMGEEATLSRASTFINSIITGYNLQQNSVRDALNSSLRATFLRICRDAMFASPFSRSLLIVV